MKEENKDWISVAEYAKKVGKSTQWVYNKIRSGEIEAIKFKRGLYNGLLVKMPKD